MINPNVADVAAAHATEIVENPANGNGYWYTLPEHATPLYEGLQGVAEYGTFSEIPGIIDEAQQSGAVLVQGAPGAGKSHLIREMQTGAVANGLPAFCLTVHINAGKASGLEVATEQLTAFREATADTGGLVILDNVDYLGYKGSSRRRNASATYAAGIEPVIADMIADPKTAVVATAHDDGWRAGRWKWADPAVDGPAQRVLEGFPSRVVFEGGMALVGLAHVMSSRQVPLGDAARTIRQLKALGRADFFHANHIDPELFARDPQAAIDEVMAGRQERIGD
jgi:hypothetical protein